MTTEQLNLLPPADRATYIQIVSYCIPFPSNFNFVLYYFRGSLIVISFFKSTADYVRCSYDIVSYEFIDCWTLMYWFLFLLRLGIYCIIRDLLSDWFMMHEPLDNAFYSNTRSSLTSMWENEGARCPDDLIRR
jgi:hypothetical protein